MASPCSGVCIEMAHSRSNGAFTIDLEFPSIPWKGSDCYILSFYNIISFNSHVCDNILNLKSFGDIPQFFPFHLLLNSITIIDLLLLPFNRSVVRIHSAWLLCISRDWQQCFLYISCEYLVGKHIFTFARWWRSSSHHHHHPPRRSSLSISTYLLYRASCNIVLVRRSLVAIWSSLARW